MRLPGAIVTGLVVLLSACMFEPANETALGSQREVVEFRGVAATPRAFVRIQAAAAPDGPFAQIATGFADAAPTLIGGATLYEFSISVAVPAAHWAQTCAGSETFVRALGGAVVFTTYDSDAIAEPSGTECIVDELEDGALFVSAAATCASPFGAPARLTATQGALSSTVLARDLRVVNPYQAEDYACLTSIAGDLRIVDPSTTDLAFPDLASVSGDLEAVYPREPGDTETRLIELPALASVGGALALESVGPTEGGQLTIELGMPALTEVGGAISITFAAKVAGFDFVRGLGAVESHLGDLTVRNLREGDTGFSNLLPALASVGGNATLDVGLTCSGVLPSLAQVDGDLDFQVGTLNSGLGALAEVGGDAAVLIGSPNGGELPALTSVGGSLALRYDTNAPGAVVPQHLAALEDVGGELGIFESEAAPIPSDVPLACSSLVLDDNPGLVDLAASLAHVSVAPPGAITITDNPNITDCEAQDWVDSLGNHPGPVTISGNGPC